MSNQKYNPSIPTANRLHKDTVFRMLFSEKKNLLSLYNALNGRCYKNPDDLIIVTLENAVYMTVKNDVAFILGTEIHLYEHQASKNPNMPMRFLLYITAEYQRMIDSTKLYSKVLQKVSTPSFIVLYNGVDPVDDHETLRLSDAFEQETGHPNLELVVDIYNVNEGYNPQLMDSCRILREYAIFVAQIRRYQRTVPIDEAVKQAVDECIEKGILADFLKMNRNEIIGICLTEFDQQAYDKMRYEEGEAEGRAKGRAEGLAEGLAKGESDTQVKVAIKLIRKGTANNEEIAEITELPIEKVEELRRQENIRDQKSAISCH